MITCNPSVFRITLWNVKEEQRSEYVFGRSKIYLGRQRQKILIVIGFLNRCRKLHDIRELIPIPFWMRKVSQRGSSSFIHFEIAHNI